MNNISNIEYFIISYKCEISKTTNSKPYNHYLNICLIYSIASTYSIDSLFKVGIFKFG